MDTYSKHLKMECNPVKKKLVTEDIISKQSPRVDHRYLLQFAIIIVNIISKTVLAP